MTTLDAIRKNWEDKVLGLVDQHAKIDAAVKAVEAEIGNAPASAGLFSKMFNKSSSRLEAEHKTLQDMLRATDDKIDVLAVEAITQAGELALGDGHDLGRFYYVCADYDYSGSDYARGIRRWTEKASSDVARLIDVSEMRDNKGKKALYKSARESLNALFFCFETTHSNRNATNFLGRMANLEDPGHFAEARVAAHTLKDMLEHNFILTEETCPKILKALGDFNVALHCLIDDILGNAVAKNSEFTGFASEIRDFLVKTGKDVPARILIAAGEKPKAPSVISIPAAQP